jgi:hypothetical protein
LRTQVLPAYDAVLWLDAGMPFLNQSAALEPLLDPRFDMVAGAGAPTDALRMRIATTQALLVRNTPHALELLHTVWALRRVDCAADPARLAVMLVPGMPVCSAELGWWQDEMGAFNWLLRARRSIGCRVRLAPLRELASPLPYYGDGDRLLSANALSDADRAALSEAFRDVPGDPALEPPNPRYAGAISGETGVVTVARVPFLAPAPPAELLAFPRGPDAWALYEPWNTPCSALRGT